MELSKPHLVHKEFDMPDGHRIRSLVIREIDGEDEREAGRWLAVRGAGIEDESVAVMNEQLRISIVAVDGKKVEQPYTAIDNWPKKTRRFVLEAFLMLNGVEDDEVSAFLGAAKDLNSEPPAAQVLSEDELSEMQNNERASG